MRSPVTRSSKTSRTARKAAAPPLARWERDVEAATLARTPGDVDQARRVFQALPPDTQMRAARELVATRAAEITRAYADVISLSAGYRLRHDRTGARRLAREVCVVVVVKKKWKPGARGAAARRVPAHFFTCWTVDGERALCAVPTDVEDGRRLARLRPQAAIAVSAPERTARRSTGAVTCAITRSGDPSTVYAMSCRHVFGMALVLDGPQLPDATVALGDSGEVVGASTPIAGPLRNQGQGTSFDSQLAEVSSLPALLKALDGLVVRDIALSWDDFEGAIDCVIRVPGREPVRAEFRAVHGEPIPYTSRLTAVRHAELARMFLPDATTTEPGDSGAPVFADGGRKLLGMHIIGDRADTSLVIPAWQLFDPANYGLPEEQWDLWRGPAPAAIETVAARTLEVVDVIARARTLAIGASVGEGGANAEADVRLVKRRLMRLGFTWLSDDANVDAAFIAVIRLFQAIKGGHQVVGGAGVDGLIEPGGDTHRWLEAGNAPRWALMPAGGTRVEGFQNVDVLDETGVDHEWGTDWLGELTRRAGAGYASVHLSVQPAAALLTVNDASKPHGGPTPDHKSHQTGLCCDLRLPRSNGTAGGITIASPTYDRDAMRAVLSAFRAQPLVTRIFLNDPALVAEGLCTRLAGHDNHAHVEMKPPPRA